MVSRRPPAYDGYSYQGAIIMHPRRYLPAALAIACLILAGCKDQRDPVKPIVDLAGIVISI
jgi:hypothetical protein